MIKKIIFVFLLAIFFFVFAKQVLAQGNSVDLYFFYGQGCPFCARAETFLNELKARHPHLRVVSFEIYNSQENRELYFSLASAYKIEASGVPAFFINDKAFIGYDDFIAAQIRNEILKCLNQKCPSPLEKISAAQLRSTEISFSPKRQVMLSRLIIILLVGIFIFAIVKFLKRKK
jgi:glutaredoxin